MEVNLPRITIEKVVKKLFEKREYYCTHMGKVCVVRRGSGEIYWTGSK